jgi:cytochrome c biogenesis protein CcmG, thiol:disulfide interchange protein DsbE
MNAAVLPKKKRTFLSWIGVIAAFLVFMLGILFAAFFVFMAMVDRHAEAEAKAKNVIDVPLPNFELALFNTPSKRVGNDDLLGAPFLITTWASWCYGCAHEHPAMLRLAKSKRIRMIGLNMQDDPTSATRWLDRHGNPYSMILVDESGGVANRFGVIATPHHILVDADGMVRWRWRGTISDEVINVDLLPLLEKLNLTAYAEKADASGAYGSAANAQAPIVAASEAPTHTLSVMLGR